MKRAENTKFKFESRKLFSKIQKVRQFHGVKRAKIDQV